MFISKGRNGLTTDPTGVRRLSSVQAVPSSGHLGFREPSNRQEPVVIREFSDQISAEANQQKRLFGLPDNRNHVIAAILGKLKAHIPIRGNNRDRN
jgi:hypothetical protein